MSTTVAEQILQQHFGGIAYETRVERLPAATRAFAARTLAGEFGRPMRAATFELDPRIHAELPYVTRYAQAIMLIAQQAPLRLEPLAHLAGAATLLEAAHHSTPATGKEPIRSTSHTTIGFERALRIGYAGVRDEIDERIARGDLDADGRDLLEGMRTCVDAALVWHARYQDALTAAHAQSTGLERERYARLIDIMTRVPEHPPRTFHGAVQALWEFWEFQRLCGNWSGVGRIDKMLGPFLERDLADGRLTLDEARDILAHFWIKGAEWIGADTPHMGYSGDAQFYQNIVLAGVDEDGNEVANEVTDLVLDIVEELHISDFPIGVRVSPRTPDRLFERIARIQRQGGGIVSMYNEDLVIEALTRAGFAPRDARNFANDGCWEVLVPGKTSFAYRPFDTLHILQEVMGVIGEPPAEADFEDFDALYATFSAKLTQTVEGIIQPDPVKGHPCLATPLLDLWVEDCIERALEYGAGGPVYTVRSPHAGGLPDTANSLYTVKKLVFDDKELTYPELRNILRNNWEGHAELRARVWKDLTLYGNDADQVDGIALRVFDSFVSACEHASSACVDTLWPPGISTFGRALQWAPQRGATPFGRLAGEVLSNNLAATPGSAKHGPTALMRSYTKFDFLRLPNGAPLDLQLEPDSLRGKTGVDALAGMLKAFINLGGWYLQVDVLDPDVLRDAQQHPECYANLAVRISGWSARFVTLDREWQDMIIQRAEGLGS